MAENDLQELNGLIRTLISETTECANWLSYIFFLLLFVFVVAPLIGAGIWVFAH
jgi:hypothetical protein